MDWFLIQGCRGRHISLSLRSSWFTEWVVGQPRLCSEIQHSSDWGWLSQTLLSGLHSGSFLLWWSTQFKFCLFLFKILKLWKNIYRKPSFPVAWLKKVRVPASDKHTFPRIFYYIFSWDFHLTVYQDIMLSWHIKARDFEVHFIFPHTFCNTVAVY